MTPPPQPTVGGVRLHIYGPDTTTDRGTVSGIGASGHHSKDIGGSSLSFTADSLETILAATPAVLEDAFAVPEVYRAGVWTAFGTPYALSPGSGTVLGERDSSRQLSPVATGALNALASEVLVLPRDLAPASAAFRYAGGIEQNRYFGWMTDDFNDAVTGWNNADVYDPTGHPKAGKPPNWGYGGGAWVYRAAAEGGLTLFRFGFFTLATETRVHISSSSDENHKVYLDGPNQGGCVIDFTGDEDGYNDQPGYWSRRLSPGTYYVAGEMRTVNSAGGDGNDSMRLAVWTFSGSYDRSMPTELLVSSSSTRVHRQSSTAERPGLSAGQVVRMLLLENYQQGVDAANLLLNNATFTDALDSSGAAWSGGKEWVWPLGTSIGTVLSDMAEDADFDMGPTFAFNAWDDRGADLSSSVGLVPGGSPISATQNILGETYESDPPGPNGYLTLCQDGFDLRLGTPPAGSRVRLGFVEYGSAPSIGRARKLADQAIRQGKTSRRYYETRIYSVTGAEPYINFTLCDRVSGRDYTNTAAVQEVTGIGWEQGVTAIYSVETGEV